jgi:hypothetical protein
MTIDSACNRIDSPITAKSDMGGRTVPHPSPDRDDQRPYIFRGELSNSLPKTLPTINPTICRRFPDANVNPCRMIYEI